MQNRDSVENQSRLIDRFILANPEITVVAEKIDNGYSGLFYDRPAFSEMIAEIKSGNANCVIVKDLTRIGRSYIETGRYLRDSFQANDVRFISIDDNIDSIQMDGFDKMIILIKSVFGEQYSVDVSVKTRNALDAKRKQGEYVGAVPVYGYQRSEPNKNKLSIDQNTFTVVQSIFHMKLHGMSAAKIALELNDFGVLSPIEYKRKQGIPHPTGGYADNRDARWSATTVLRILRDENYTGVLVQRRQRCESYKSKVLLNLDENEWYRTENAHPPIISKEDYCAVQRVLALDTRTAPAQKEVHIFSGMLICGCCNSKMTRKTTQARRQRYIYHYCPTGKKKGCSSTHMISEKALHDKVLLAVNERIKTIERLSSALSATQIVTMLENDLLRQLAACNQQIQTLQRFRASLFDNLTNATIDETEFQTLKEHYNGEISRQEAEVSALQKKWHCIRESPDTFLAWINNFLPFAGITGLDRFALVKMIQCIRVMTKHEIIIDFVYQHEFEQLVRCVASGGR